jgi:small subunit ribosomal protein S2
MHFVNQRWLGGTLTNFQTIRKSTQKLKQLEEAMQDGTYDALTKKELLKLEREREKLEKYFGGIKNMGKLPDAVFVVDTRKESIALNEARKTGVPAIAIVDTNCQPDGIDFIIPGNDDAIRAIHLMTSKLADAVLEGTAESEAQMDEALIEQEQQSDPEAQPPAQESDADEVVKVEGQ